MLIQSQSQKSYRLFTWSLLGLGVVPIITAFTGSPTEHAIAEHLATATNTSKNHPVLLKPINETLWTIWRYRLQATQNNNQNTQLKALRLYIISNPLLACSSKIKNHWGVGGERREGGVGQDRLTWTWWRGWRKRKVVVARSTNCRKKINKHTLLRATFTAFCIDRLYFPNAT